MASQTLLECIAENVRRQRSAKGLTQSQLADMIGVTRPRISQIESGRGDPSVGTIERVAKALGVDPAALMLHVETLASA